MDDSPFTERENILRSIQQVLGIRFNESDLSLEARGRIDQLASLEQRRKTKNAESWNYFTRVQRYWILFYALLVLGIAFLVLILGVVFFVADVFLYRWIRKRERTTPQSSFESLELGRSLTTELKVLFDKVKEELLGARSKRSQEFKVAKELDNFVGRAVWVDMDSDHGSYFKPRKGIVVRVFARPSPSGREAIVVELASPPRMWVPMPRRIRYLVMEYYLKWDSVHVTFGPRFSFVRVLRLKNEAVLKSDTYGPADALRIGFASVTAWPVRSSEEMILEEHGTGPGSEQATELILSPRQL